MTIEISVVYGEKGFPLGNKDSDDEIWRKLWGTMCCYHHSMQELYVYQQKPVYKNL